MLENARPEYLTPVTRGDVYSPVQVRHGIVHPDMEDFPPYDQRVSQCDYPIPKTVAECHPMRVTLQTSDVCQLACPGCYVGEWTNPNGSVRLYHARKDTPEEQAQDQIRALGDSLQDVFYLGVEPTLRPDMMQAVTEVAREIGATTMSITNGASPLSRYEATFRTGIRSGDIYKINLSIDSIDPTINDRIRGKKNAFERTLKTIEHAIERNDPVKVNITVWPDNYHTVIDTVEALFAIGVRGFAFHCGSLEGVPDPRTAKLAHLDPLAWRALCSRLIEFRDGHEDSLQNFTLPFIFFTESELRDGIIGDVGAYEEYKKHASEVESGVLRPNPIRVCPALDVPQVYVFGNDGKYQQGAVSLCNIHTIGANRKHGGDAYFAHYDPIEKQFVTEPDPNSNELVLMRQSPYLCPAREYDMADKVPIDRTVTDGGDLHHACRYVSANQLPGAETMFGADFYEDYERFYKVWSRVVGEADFDKLKRIKDSAASIKTKLTQILALECQLLAEATGAYYH